MGQDLTTQNEVHNYEYIGLYIYTHTYLYIYILYIYVRVAKFYPKSVKWRATEIDNLVVLVISFWLFSFCYLITMYVVLVLILLLSSV